MRLGMAWPEEIDQTVDATWYLKWQSEAELDFKSRKTDGAQWVFWFFIRTAIFGFVLFHLFQFMTRKVPRFLGYGPLRRNPNLQKFVRLVILCSFACGIPDICNLNCFLVFIKMLCSHFFFLYPVGCFI